MYRPPNWENPYIAKIKEVADIPIQPMALISWKEMAIEAKKHYEAGADAMLESLRKSGEKIDAGYGQNFDASVGMFETVLLLNTKDEKWARRLTGADDMGAQVVEAFTDEPIKMNGHLVFIPEEEKDGR